jgi:hypothetical protein
MNSYTGGETARGFITADMSGNHAGWFRIKIGRLEQLITLTARPRHFGGRQWYFLCPFTLHQVSVLWMPPGARSFGCRQSWGRQVAYESQCIDRTGRAHRGKAKINSKLCSIGGFDTNEWDLPPKPKWMRWRTYNRAEEKFDRYEAILDRASLEKVARLLRFRL